MPLSRIPIAYGQGLDRETGAMAVRPGTIDDLRNIYHRRGKVVVRKGNQSRLEFVDANGEPMTVVLAGHMLLGERTGVIAAYQGNSGAAAFGDVDIYLIDGAATVQRRLGNWFNTLDLGLDPAIPPIVSITDSFNRAFFAHDELRITQRADTVVYDPFEGAEIQPLMADLDGEGEAAVKFRGVEKYLQYMFGWGFGSATKDRAELVRTSIPGDPKTFRAEHYFIAGARRDPTVVCSPAGNVLCVFKETESYRIFGFSRDTFGIEPLDLRFGCIAPRLAVSVGGLTYFWSTEGPMVTDGQVVRDISNELELGGVDPVDLIERGELLQGWANYVAEQDLVLFAFNRRIYVLSLHDTQDPRWSYWELGFDQFTGFQLFDTGIGAVSTVAPTGFPTWGVEKFGDVDPDQLRPVWMNVDQDGDERVEIWLRESPNLMGENWRLNTDEDTDGVVDGFSSFVDSGITEEFLLDATQDFTDQNSQHVEIVESTGPGETGVQIVIEGQDGNETDKIVAGELYTITIEVLTKDLVNTAEAAIAGRWLDDTDTEVGSFEETGIKHPDRFDSVHIFDEEAPAGATKLELTYKMSALAADDTGIAFFRRAALFKVSEQQAWERKVGLEVSTVDTQDTLIGDLPAGTFYEIALRYRRGVTFAIGYESGDPDNWPSKSKGVTLTRLDPPTIDPDDEIIWSLDEANFTVESGVVTDVEAISGYVLDYMPADDEQLLELWFENTLLQTIEAGTISFKLQSSMWRDQYVTLSLAHRAQQGVIRSKLVDFPQVWAGPVDPPGEVQLVTGSDLPSGAYQVTWDWSTLKARYADLDTSPVGFDVSLKIEENVNGGGWSFVHDEPVQTKQDHVREGLNPGDEVSVRVAFWFCKWFVCFRTENIVRNVEIV